MSILVKHKSAEDSIVQGKMYKLALYFSMNLKCQFTFLDC